MTEELKNEIAENPTNNPVDNQKDSQPKEEMQKAIEAARQDEKAKLYKTLNKLNEENEQKSSELKILQEQLGQVNTKFSKISEAFVEKKEPTPEELAKTTLTEIHQLKESLLREKESFQQEIKTAKLELYREKQMAEYGDELIAEMVIGNNEAEISTSVQKAHEAYNKLRDKFAREAEETTKARKQGTKLPPNRVPSSEPAGEPEVDENARKVKGMSMDEYEKQRENLLKLVKSR